MVVSSHETCLEYFQRRLSEGWKCIKLDGYNAILLSTGGIRRELDLRNDIETLRPNDIGDETAIGSQYPAEGEHWDKVDEVTADGTATRVMSTSNVYQRDLYNLPAPSGSGVINKITVYFRCWGDYTSYCLAKASIKSDSIVNDGSSKSFTEAFTWYNFTEEWSINPADSEAWEWTDINTLQIGVSTVGYPKGMIETWCTQVYVEIDYTPPPSWTGPWNTKTIVKWCGKVIKKWNKLG